MGQWLFNLALIVALIFFSLVVFRFLSNLLKRVSRKTDTKLDDIFVEIIIPLITALVIIFGVREILVGGPLITALASKLGVEEILAAYTLTIPESATIRLNIIFQISMPVILIAWLVVKFVETLHKEYGISVKYVMISKILFVLGFGVALLVINYIRMTQARNCYHDCTGANLVNINLTGDDLSGSNFIEANLRGSNLSEANLQGADLSGANLVGTNLSNANLSHAALIGTDLSFADLRGANLSSTDMSGATLIGANLAGTDLTQTRLRGVVFDDAQLIGVDMRKVNLIGASFVAANMSGIDMSGADLSGASLSGADLSGAILVNTDLRGSSANLADLNGADLRNATLIGTSLVGSNLASANLSKSNMTSAVLVGANLNGADLNSANLTDVQLFIAELNLSDLQQFDPVMAELNELQLEQIVTDANVGGIQFNSATKWPQDKLILLSGILGSQFTQDNLASSNISGSNPVEEEGSIKLPRVNPAQVQGDILISGNASVSDLSETISSFFSNQSYTGTILIETTTSDVGFERFCEEGIAEIANSNRAASTTETRICTDNGLELLPFEIGTDALVVIVNPANDFLSDVTMEELADIFTAERWSDVNSNWPAREIVRFVPNPESDNFAAFVNKVFDNDPAKLLAAPNTTFSPRPSDQVLGVVNNRDAINFLSHSYYQQNAALVKPLSIDNAEPIALAIKTDMYPLTTPLFIYSAPSIIQQKPQVEAFISFYLTRINSIIEQSGYFPASVETLNQSKTTLIDAMATQDSK